ncbi:heme-binding protein [Mycolicibacterium bacteremicum]|uniref:Hemophore-related protein n=1 Tax=Mycolicibacterium bacteremicum TaxID=564198 RepID=A0A1W9YZ80_MYCBA|nr:heme-binding protein [Mycolicibacterium bacteremicum]ORA05345.1 hemophore-related protein [Mycolicibacterium bacteremicum]
MSTLRTGFTIAAMTVAAGFAVTAPAAAEPPPNCTAADVAGVAGGVNIAMSGYLFTHPDVNAFLTGLEGLPPEQIKEQARGYLAANPQTANEIRGIRQPLTDLRARCNVTAPLQHDVLG